MQLTRLITRYRTTGQVKASVSAHQFATRYTVADVDLLAYIDKAHGNLSGPATRRILEREDEAVRAEMLPILMERSPDGAVFTGADPGPEPPITRQFES